MSLSVSLIHTQYTCEIIESGRITMKEVLDKESLFLVKAGLNYLAFSSDTLVIITVSMTHSVLRVSGYRMCLM